MIKRPPKDWKDLQNQVNDILNQSGLTSVTNKAIETVRGDVNIDVYAEDNSTQPTTTYLCECKHWISDVTKTIVHAFRTVVLDYGANWGFIISSSGFQSGAYEAAKNSPIRLLNWNEFQELFVDRWIQNYLFLRLSDIADPLIEYTEPINSRIFKKAQRLDSDKQKKFIELRQKYQILGILPIRYLVARARITLPLRNKLINTGDHGLPDDLIDAIYLQDFVDIYCRYAIEAINEFDQIFGERA